MKSHLTPVLTSDLRPVAASATLHCLTGCAIGEVVGLVVAIAAMASSAGAYRFNDVLECTMRLCKLKF